MAVNPNTTFSAGAILTAAQMNRLPWGVMGYATKTTTQTGITTAATDITSLTVTFTANTLRVYRTTIYALVQQNTSAGAPNLTITDTSNVIKATNESNIASASNYLGFTLSVVGTGLSGSTVRKARAQTNANTCSVLGAATYPAFILVEDIGQA